MNSDQALADQIKRIVDGAPPLTPEQIAKLTILLHPGYSHTPRVHALVPPT